MTKGRRTLSKDELGNLREHARKYKIADIVLSLKSNLAFRENTYNYKFRYFRFYGQSDDELEVRLHHDSIPEDSPQGEMFYRKPPLRIYKTDNRFIYELFVENKPEVFLRAVFRKDFKEGDIYKDTIYTEMFRKGEQTSLLSFPTDRAIFSQFLAKRRGMILHSCGVIFDSKGYIFAGHSNQGKSTVARLFMNEARILNDENIIIKEKSDGVSLYGTPWYGEVTRVLPDSAPLKAVFLLRKAKKNMLRAANKKETALMLFDCAIKPLVDKEWAEKTLNLCDRIAEKIPCYHLYFKKDKSVVEFLKRRVFEKQKD